MTNEEMKSVLEKSGMPAESIEKMQDRFDAKIITQIVENSSGPGEAFAMLHGYYPELDVDALQKQCDFVMEQVEAGMKQKKPGENLELSENELDQVSGGGLFSAIGDWFQDNWKSVAIGAAVVVGAALVCTGVGAAIGSAFITGGTAINSTIVTAMGVSYCTEWVAVTAASTGAMIGAGAGTAIGGAVTGALVGTDVL